MRALSLRRLPECQDAIGMENGAISDGQVSASSQWDVNHAPKQGRLNFQAVPGKAGSWSARANDVNQWFQIDLRNQNTKVTRVATQGRNAYGQWVTKYKLQYSNDGQNFHYYREQGQSAIKVIYDSIGTTLKKHFSFLFDFNLHLKNGKLKRINLQVTRETSYRLNNLHVASFIDDS